MQDETWLSERDGPSIRLRAGRVIIYIPMQFRRRGGRKEILEPPGGSNGGSGATSVYKPLAVAIARAHRWRDLLDQGRFRSVNELAEAVGVDRGHVGRLLNLALLAPDIVERILEGEEPSGLSLRQLTRIMPSRWDEQRRLETSFRHPDSRDDGHP